MKLSRRSVLALPIAAAMVGCGGTQPTNSMTLSVAQNSEAFSYFVPFVTQQHGFFKAAGLTFDPSRIPVLGNGTKTSAAVLSGSVQVGVGTITDAFTVSRVDDDLRIIGGFSNAFLIDVVASKAFLASSRLSRTSPLADKVAALVGKKIGISAPGSATDALITYLLRQHGYDDQHAVRVNLNTVTPAAGLSALSSGRVDAISWPVPVGQEAAARNIGEIFISPVLGDIPALAGMTYGTIYTTQSVIDSKPRAIAALIRAIASAETWIAEHPTQATEALKAFLQLDQKTTTAVAQAAMSSVPHTPMIDEKGGYAVANEFHVKAGLIAIALPYKDVVAASTISQALTSVRR